MAWRHHKHSFRGFGRDENSDRFRHEEPARKSFEARHARGDRDVAGEDGSGDASGAESLIPVYDARAYRWKDAIETEGGRFWGRWKKKQAEEPEEPSGGSDTGETDPTGADAGDAGAGETDPTAPDVEETDGADTGAGGTENDGTGEPDATEPDPAEPDTGETDPVGADAGEPDAGEPDTGGADPVEPDPEDPDAGGAETGGTDPAEPDPVEPDAGETDPGETDTAEPGGETTDPVDTDPIDADPVAEEEKILLTSYTSGGAAETSSNIEVVFNGDWTIELQDAFVAAADYLSSIITGDLFDVTTGGTVIDDLRIQASIGDIDGFGGVLAQAGPSMFRSDIYLPSAGTMTFDSTDAGIYDSAGLFDDIVLHEMIHVLGFGSLFGVMGLTSGSVATGDLVYTGANANAAYRAEYGADSFIPLETDGGNGTAGGHWDEAVFDDELMTGFFDSDNHLSAMSIAALEDMGYDTIWDPSDPTDIGGGALFV